MRIAICEDDISVSSQLVEWLEIESLNQAAYMIKTYNTGDQFWFSYQDSLQPFDLIILDIEMPGELNGLDVAKKIREEKDNVPIIILTSFVKYALVGYDVHPFHYLVKPAQKEKLLDIVNQVENRLQVNWESCLNISYQKGFLRIPFDEIIYIESHGHNVFIHTHDQKHKLYRKLDDILEMCDERFIITHKSYAINANMINKVESKYRNTFVILRNGYKIPVSQQKKSDFLKMLVEYDRSYCSVQV